MTKDRAKIIGRKGRLKDGKSRPAVLSLAERKEIAQCAARTRWAKKDLEK